LPAGTAHIFDKSIGGSEKAFVTKAIATVTRAKLSRREEASIEAAQVLP